MDSHLSRLEIISIGRLGKPYGFSGAIHVYLDDGLELLTVPQFVFISIEGLPVPFRVVEQGTHNGTLTLTLDRVDSKEGIEQYKNATISVESKYVSIDHDESDELIGYTVVDQHGTEIGTIEDIIEQEPLLFLSINRIDSKRELIVPYHGDLLLDSNVSKRILTLEMITE